MATDLAELQNKLWEAADQLRANSGLKASEYASPVLGLIFLRYADERFAQASQSVGPGSDRRPTGPEDYQAVGALYLPEESRFEGLLDLPEDADIGKAINQAMGGIEVYNPDLQGVLPKDYSRIPDDILGELLRLLRALPQAIEGDGFGLIYEYFLSKFAFSEGQKGGEFFTPTSIVRLIVEILEPFHGKIYDPACGSGGMFVQSAHFVERHRRDPGQELSIYGQEKTGDTVRLFRDSIADGATVPLYYENRTPELQLTNEDFDDELDDFLEEAVLDDAQEKAVARRFSQQYELITRPQRLKEIAADLVHHFVNRGFRGKAMYVAIDKAVAVRMYDLVEAEWARYLAELEARLADTPELERPHLESLIEFMRTTDMAVVVSQAQNEIADMAAAGLDIAKHRKRMVDEDLDSKFKDPADPFRLVFVCAMWLTGFDSPSTSTVYLDKPMRNHLLMQTIARANRVFPDKDNGLIVDYVGVFRNLERALAIYAADRTGADIDLPIRPKDDLIAELDAALADITEFCEANDVDLRDLEAAQGFEFVASVGGADPLIDLNKIDFEQLALRFAANKRTVAKTIKEELEERLDDAVRKNPTRLDLAERFRQLIDEYNAGTHNIEELLRRLGALNKELSDEEQRAVREGLTEAELAVFDLLTKPEPELTDAETTKVKAAAKRLLEHIEEKLVLDWKRDQQTRSAVRVFVKDVLDAELPSAYGPEMFTRKVDAIFDHIYVSFGDDGDGGSVYEAPAVAVAGSTSPAATLPTTAEQVDDALLVQICSDPARRARLLEEILGTTATWACTAEELLSHDESRTVEYKQTARWNVQEERRDKRMEAVVVKTVAGMLNDPGGTLLIGVADDGTPVGLDDDYAQVMPANADGYINWLDTLFENSIGHAGASRLRIRIDRVNGHDVCRIDVPSSSRPIRVKNSSGDDILYQRRSNSTRPVPPSETDAFIAERFGQQDASAVL